MAGEKISVTLEGNVLAAFQIFCTKNSVKTGGEGIRMLVRDLPEFKQLSSNNNGQLSTVGTPGQEKSQ